MHPNNNLDDILFANTIEDDTESDKVPFEYNFISKPWDDRTKKSKIGVMCLLLAILLAIIAGVVNMFVIQYEGFEISSSRQVMNCRRVKIEDYMFVTRIHSATTGRLLCVAALVERDTALVDYDCINRGQAVLRAGNPLSIQCRSAYKFEVVQNYPSHGGYTMSLIKVENLDEDCVKEISVGDSLDANIPLYSIGSPLQSGRLLMWHPLILAPIENCSDVKSPHFDKSSVLCLMHFAMCAVEPGDLLFQNDQLYGLALSRSVANLGTNDTKMSYFTKTDFIVDIIKNFRRF